MSVDGLNEILFSGETCFFVKKKGAIYFCEYNFLQKLSPVIVTSTYFEKKFPSLCKFYSWSGRNIYFGRCVVSFFSTFFSIDYSWSWRALWLIFQKKKKKIYSEIGRAANIIMKLQWILIVGHFPFTKTDT